MTNFIQTDQIRSKCSEHNSVSEARCSKHSDCQNISLMTHFNGRWTGRCLLPSKVNYYNITNQTKGLCELQGKLMNSL